MPKKSPFFPKKQSLKPAKDLFVPKSGPLKMSQEDTPQTPAELQIPLPVKGILGALSTWPDRIGLKADTKRAELRAKYINANNAIITGMAATEKAKIELQYSKKMWLAHYETYLAQQNLEQWRIQKMKDLEEAEYDSKIAEFKKNEARAKESMNESNLAPGFRPKKNS